MEGMNVELQSKIAQEVPHPPVERGVVCGNFILIPRSVDDDEVGAASFPVQAANKKSSKCRICGEQGHNARTCTDAKANKSQAEVDKILKKRVEKETKVAGKAAKNAAIQEQACVDRAALLAQFGEVDTISSIGKSPVLITTNDWGDDGMWNTDINKYTRVQFKDRQMIAFDRDGNGNTTFTYEDGEWYMEEHGIGSLNIYLHKDVFKDKSDWTQCKNENAWDDNGFYWINTVTQHKISQSKYPKYRCLE